MSVVKKLFISILILFISLSICFAESDFEKYLKQQVQEFNAFKEERDKEFTNFLKQQWVEFNSFKGMKRDETPKPIQKPIIKIVKPKPVVKPKQVTKPKPVSKPKPKPVVIKKIEIPKPKVKPPVVVKPKPLPKTIVQKQDKFNKKIINYFGIKTLFLFDRKYFGLKLANVNNDSISKFWQMASTGDYEPLISEIKNVKKKLLLNDWAVYELVDRLSQEISNDENIKVLFSWFLMNKMGYQTKVGYINNKIYLLMPSQQPIYEITYFKFDGIKYYAVNTYDNKNFIKSLYTYKKNYPNADLKLNLALNNMPIINEVPGEKQLSFKYKGKEYSFKVKYNNNYVRFFKKYPQTDIGIYFNADASNDVKETLLNDLKPIVVNKTEQEAVNILLRFVQTAFDYKTDQQQFGYEKYLLPDETIYYPYSDCEDRSVLFAYLVRNLLGLEVVGLDFPGHVSTAVHFKGNVAGDSFMFNGKKYVIADPTYINATIGMTMPKYKNVKPKFIPLKTL